MSEEAPVEQVEIPAESPAEEAPVESPAEPAPAPVEEPADDADFGVCKLQKFRPQQFVDALTPYKNWVDTIQGMLFWRRPIAMGLLLLVVELTFIFIYKADLGALSVLCMAFSFRYIFELVYRQYGETIGVLFFKPLENPGTEEESNHIYPLLPICQRSSFLASRIYDLIYNSPKKETKSITDYLFPAGVLFVLFVFFSLTGTFWFIFVLVHIILLAPGIIFYPKVFPYVKPYCLQFASSIGCPYCQADLNKQKTE